MLNNMKKFDKLTKLALMGRLVEFTYEYERLEEEGNYRHWVPKKLDKMKTGWIVGFRTLQNGVYKPYSACHGMDGPEYDQAYLSVTSTVPCVLISTYFDSNPVRVPLEHFFQSAQSPMLIKRPGEPWKDEHRKQMSEWSKDFPRDCKGRFIKQL